MVRVVVTGALGHIGSRLIREIPSWPGDHQVLMLDNFATKRYPSLFDLPTNGQYRLQECDILTADLVSIFSGADSVVHLAAITDAATSFEKRDEVERVNYLGTQTVARACAEAGVPLGFPSTTSVYGTQAETVDEDCSTDDLKPQSPYAESKLKAEQYLGVLGESDGLRFVICRFGTIFGVSPGMRFHTAVNKFCWQAVTGQPLTVWRTALNQKRPYLDLSDAVAAFAFIVRNGLFDGEVYNVVTVNTSVRTVVDLIAAHVPDLSVEYVDTEIMNQLSYEVSSDRFATRGFEFRGSLAQGIADTIGLLAGVGVRRK